MQSMKTILRKKALRIKIQCFRDDSELKADKKTYGLPYVFLMRSVYFIMGMKTEP